MEDALRVAQRKRKNNSNMVLILVLVENALRGDALRDMAKYVES